MNTHREQISDKMFEDVILAKTIEEKLRTDLHVDVTSRVTFKKATRLV